MPDSLTPAPKTSLRAWQRRALERLGEWQEGPFLISAAPGAGKTRPALEFAHRELSVAKTRALVVICPTAQLGVFPPDSLEAALYLSTVCSFANNTTSTTAHPDGTFAATFTVTRDNTTTSPGPPFPPAGPPFRCGLAPSDCVILAGSVVGRFVEASAPISFTPPVPISTDECRHDGWRHRADDRGRPFRNQGQCVRFVVHHR